MHDGARVEGVLGTQNGLKHVAGPVLNGSLDDDVKEVGGASLLDDDFAGPEIPDVERRLEFFDF
jgi:hypothetical protein